MSADDEPGSRYGVASLDTLDDDEPSSSSSAAAPSPAAASSAAASSTSAAANGTAAPAAEPAVEVESYSTAVGVIEPPPDLKAIIDRTADYIKSHGPQSEGDIIQRMKGKKQFQFLENPASPYHPYYRQRVKYGAEGPPKSAVRTDHVAAHAKAAEAKLEADRKAREEEAAAEALRTAKKKLTLTERLRAHIQGVHQPSKEIIAQAEAKLKELSVSQSAAQQNGATSASHHNGPMNSTTAATSSVFTYRLRHPEQYSPVDIDIVKLTALYLSRNGTDFLHGLQRREARNPYFDFLKPQHPLFVFFQHLVEAYKSVILPKTEVKEDLRKKVKEMGKTEYYHTLLRDALVRKKIVAAQKQAREEETEVAVIDWKDFVVCARIEFIESEDEFLPAPRDTIEEMAAMLTAQTLNEQAEAEARAAASQSGDMDMEVDEVNETETTADIAVKEEAEVAQLIRAAAPPPADENLEVRMDHSSNEPTSRNSKQAVFQKCIVCGDEIAVDDLAEHMRIELLDPKWKEQKQALLDRQRESSLTSDATVGVNLARLAKKTMQRDETANEKRAAEIKAAKQALADAILIYGPHSQQAALAAQKAGEIAPVLPVKPVTKPQAPAPTAAPIGPTLAPGAAAAGVRLLPPTSAAPQPPRPSPSSHAPGIPGMMAPGLSGPPGMPHQQQQQQQLYPPGMAPGTFAPYVPAPMPPSMPGYMPHQPHQPMIPGLYQPAPQPSMMPPGVPGMAPFSSPPPGVPGLYQPGAPLLPQVPTSSGYISSQPSSSLFPNPHAGVVHAAPPVAHEDQPAAKKQRMNESGASNSIAPPPSAASSASATAASKGKLLSESEFLALHPSGKATFDVVVPNDSASPYNFAGQTVTLTMSLTATIQQMKDQLKNHLKEMPPNKMKLQFAASSSSTGNVHINKDDVTLAFYNVAPGAKIMLGIKERGGKKK